MSPLFPFPSNPLRKKLLTYAQASPPSPLPASPFPKDKNNRLEQSAAGAGSVGADGQCQCVCAFPSTTIPAVASVTTTKGFDAPASEEPTTTIRETRSTFQTVVISGTSTAVDVAPTEAPEMIELDTSAVPIIIASTLIIEPVISSIPAASFGVGDTTLAPASSSAEPTASPNPSVSVVDTEIALDTSVVLATSTIASSTAFVTTTAAPSASAPPAEEAPVFTTTLDAPLATPEIGQIPKSQAAQGGESETDVSAPTAVESEVPSQTAVQAEALVTPAPQGEVGGEEINSYELSSAIVLGNLGG